MPLLSDLFSICACVALLCLIPASTAGQPQCTDQSGCFPPVRNLALGRTINVSSTCISGSTFCILNQGCDATTNICNPETTHSPTNINDENNGSLWISEIGSNDIVTLQIDLEAPVLFESMTIVWASARPQSMVLERSQDNGQSWQVYRYYSASCNSTFMLPEAEFSTNFNSTDAICTMRESFINPSFDGLVSIFVCSD